MKKWIWSVVGVIVIVSSVLLWFYNSVNNEFDAAERQAIKWTYELTSLTEVDHVEFFAGATNYTVVFGYNNDGEDLIVWVSDEEIHEKKASDGVSRSAIREQVIQRNGTVNMVHITPGKLGAVWVWEVFYKKQENDGTRHYYDYYRFADGEWLDTYTLNLED